MSAALQEKGFKRAGEWRLVDGKPNFCLGDFATQTNVLYAFVCDGEVKYIGKTEQKLRRRMRRYRKERNDPGDMRKVHKHLHPKIREGKSVLIYVRPCSRGELTEMEGRCIRALNPDWNGSGR